VARDTTLDELASASGCTVDELKDMRGMCCNSLNIYEAIDFIHSNDQARIY
jgi:hypothetical protein